MPKHSYEDTYPWYDSNRWGVTASVDTMKWVIKTWDEGLLESESDYKNLVDFNSTLESLHNKLKTQTNGTNVQQEVSPGGAAATPIGGVKTPAAGDRHRLPLDQYDTLKSSGDAIAEKCKIWVGSAGEERGKLGALCRRFLYMGGFQEKARNIQEYENLDEPKKTLLSAVTDSSTRSTESREEFCKTTYKKVEDMEEKIRAALKLRSSVRVTLFR